MYEHRSVLKDSVLKEIGKRVSDEMRSSDIMIRWGGEAFLVLCPRTDLKDALMLAERLREKITAGCGEFWRRPLARIRNPERSN